MSIVQLSYEEKVIVDRILSDGYVPNTVTISVSDYLCHSDIIAIEEFIGSHDDRASKTFINNVLRDNK